MSRKTAIVVISVAVVVLAAAVLVFFIWFRTPDIEPPEGGAFPGVGEGGFPSKQPETPTVLPDVPAPRLTKLSTEPIAGAIIGTAGGKPVVRYVERATGHLYQVDPALPTPERLTNTTIPAVYEALWQKNGGGVVLRYLKDDNETVETYYAAVKKARGGLPATPARAGEGYELQGTFLPSNIKGAVLSPDGAELLYLREEQDSGVIYTTRLGSGTRREVLRSPLREWALLWPNRGRALVLPKPSIAAAGFLGTLSPESGRLETVLSGKRGLTANAGAGPQVLISESVGDSFQTTVFNLETKAVSASPLLTLPEKCSWSPRKASTIYCGVPKTIPRVAYPDAWYQGVSSFEDELWSADLETGNVALLGDLASETITLFDIVDLKVSDDESYLIFTNKRDSLLWSYRLAE